MTCAPAGCVTEVPTARICSPSTSTSPRVTRRPLSTSSRCAACRTMGACTAGSAIACRAGIASASAAIAIAGIAIAIAGARVQPLAGWTLDTDIFGMGHDYRRALGHSIQLEIAILQRDHMGFVADLVAQIQENDDRNHEVAGDEVEPGEYRGLEHGDVGAEQHHQEQHQREPWTIGIELGFEFEVIHAASLRHPGLAETQVADG